MPSSVAGRIAPRDAAPWPIFPRLTHMGSVDCDRHLHGASGPRNVRTARLRARKSGPALTYAIALLAGWMPVVACATAPSAPVERPAAETDTAITLGVGQTAAPEGAPAAVTLTDVHDDSRCPADATCVWAGDAAVTLEVRPAGGDAERVVLRLNTPDARSARAAGLLLRFESLEPQPRTGRSIALGEYRVRLSLAW